MHQHNSMYFTSKLSYNSVFTVSLDIISLEKLFHGFSQVFSKTYMLFFFTYFFVCKCLNKNHPNFH